MFCLGLIFVDICKARRRHRAVTSSAQGYTHVATPQSPGRLALRMAMLVATLKIRAEVVLG